jgi:hypothetical protein
VSGDPLRRWALLAIALTVTGCATVDPYATAPMSEHVQRSGSVGDCARLFRDADARVDAAGVRDAAAPRVAGFPYLRVDRFSAALAPTAQQQRAFGPYSEVLAALDRQARAAEFANLADTTLPPPAAFDRCRDALALADHDRLAALAAAATVPDDYSTLARALGLYPLTRLFFAAGIAQWQRETQTVFALPLDQLPVHGQLTTYTPTPQPPSPPDAPRAAAFGLPAYGTAGWAELLARHAPRLVIDTAGEDDRIGAPHWQAQASSPQIAVDTAAPTAYLRIAFTRVNDQVLAQLVYTFWFPARTADGALDLLAGRLDGLIWRVTLAPDGTPLVYDTIHPCGCYHQFFPTEQVRARSAPQSLDEGLFAPQSLNAPRADQRIELRLAARTHYVQRVSVVPATAATAAIPYEFLDEDHLRSMSLPGGGSRSAYGPDGLVAGSERGERYLFWPMGIASAGQMRQWGRHATAFVGRRHFDDADLFDRYFEILPAQAPPKAALAPAPRP